MDSQPSSPYVPPAKLSRDEKLQYKISVKEKDIQDAYAKYERSREIIIENLRRMEIKHQSAIAQKKITLAKWKTLLDSYKSKE